VTTSEKEKYDNIEFYSQKLFACFFWLVDNIEHVINELLLEREKRQFYTGEKKG